MALAAAQNGRLHSMGISWEQELRDTLNRTNNDLGEVPADALPVPKPLTT